MKSRGFLRLFPEFSVFDMDSIKVCGIVICALSVLLMFKNLRSEYSLFIRIILTLGVAIVTTALIYPILSYVCEISSGTALEKHLPSLIKALGIAISVQITADICKDAGEDAIGSRIYLFGQAEILIISIPIIKSLLSLCGDLIK